MINKKKVTMASLSTISMAFNPRDWSIEICQLQSNAKQFTNPSMHRKNCELPTVPLRILMRLQKSIQQMRATHVQQGSGDPSVRNIPSKIMAALFPSGIGNVNVETSLDSVEL